jgi:hypothetical protein
MSHTLRNRVIILALILLLGQLTLVVHATVHNPELSCQLCLSQSHYSKGIPSLKLNMPDFDNHVGLILVFKYVKPTSNIPKAYFQRAPPATSEN